MANYEEDLIRKNGQAIQLSNSEKQTMKNRILSMPISREDKLGGFSFWELFSGKKFVAAALCAVFLIGGGSLTYASQNSGPGDLLHSLELNVIEPLEYIAQITPERKTDFTIDRLQERLSELQNSPSDEITNAAVADAIENIQSHVNKVLPALTNADGSENQESQKGQENIDQLVNISALVNAHEDLLIELGKNPEDIEGLNDDIEESLSDQLGEYLNQQSVSEQSETVENEINDIKTLIGSDPDDADALAAQGALISIQESYLRGNFEQALQEAIDTKIQILAQDYAEGVEPE